jgi:hypothetical protein
MLLLSKEQEVVSATRNYLRVPDQMLEQGFGACRHQMPTGSQPPCEAATAP